MIELNTVNIPLLSLLTEKGIFPLINKLPVVCYDIKIKNKIKVIPLLRPSVQSSQCLFPSLSQCTRTSYRTVLKLAWVFVLTIPVSTHIGTEMHVSQKQILVNPRNYVYLWIFCYYIYIGMTLHWERITVLYGGPFRYLYYRCCSAKGP